MSAYRFPEHMQTNAFHPRRLLLRKNFQIHNPPPPPPPSPRPHQIPQPPPLTAITLVFLKDQVHLTGHFYKSSKSPFAPRYRIGRITTLLVAQVRTIGISFLLDKQNKSSLDISCR